ncbi:hypothetical protein [Ulvibacter litoralis]|uniref:Thrombospondin type 3 repeat-containing protein n=1 Tax=Ulvibacter litoralis TaxID=227084 RepID=A0A1G7FVQ2_9FLAO|nr:hypothetical protein [Ulvibacter litoralis]GHC64031.1 hypothetical protein GCM10008083_31630 [Ulvibacter litoralis]SDE79872.1 hypothetical protein SAMN05421855_102804 [Ulvibacter litoralis]
MKKLLTLLFVSSLFLACNDGDIIITSFDFEDSDLENCGEIGNYVFFKINNNAQESISLKLNTTDSLFWKTKTNTYTLDGTTKFVNYRKYDADLTSAYFCNSVPPIAPLVTVEYLGTSGTATIITTVTREDNDGVEETNLTLDTDGDGIPNYYDDDDDGDNIPTAAELGDDPTNPKDTDGDSIPDYLDEDDDNDLILTRNEDLNGNLNPLDDVTAPSEIPNYLNPDVTTETVINEYRSHTYDLSSDIIVQVLNVVLINSEEQINQEVLDFGDKTDVLNTTVTKTPVFQ